MVIGSGARAVARCDELGSAAYSATEDGLFRAYLTPAHAAALGCLSQWMQQAGMTTRLDSAANLIGRYEGQEPGAPALLIGSHIDTVRNAGNYDGPLGVMLGIECVAALQARGKRAPFAIEVIAFGDEEGSRFASTMLCSRAVAGTLSPQAWDIVDGDGLSARNALAAFWQFLPASFTPESFDPEHSGIGVLASAARSKAEVFAYLEAHIEQGPVLEAEDLALGVVSGIAAQLRFHVSLEGQAGHAGTTAMHLRHDALVGAAEMICAIEKVANQSAGEVVATVGQLKVKPGAVNVVPGGVEFSIDVRSGKEAARDLAALQIKQALQALASQRDLRMAITQIQDLPATPCDPTLIQTLSAAIAAHGRAPRVLVSGAGHDAMSMAALCPSAMLFIRCEKGISHSPAESVRVDDVEAALATMLSFIELLESEYHG